MGPDTETHSRLLGRVPLHSPSTLMKLDVNALRYLARDDFRTLTAIEQGERNVREKRERGQRERERARRRIPPAGGGFSQCP